VEAANLGTCQHGQFASYKNKYNFGTVLGCHLTFIVKYCKTGWFLEIVKCVDT